jgi:cytochrome P450
MFDIFDNYIALYVLLFLITLTALMKDPYKSIPSDKTLPFFGNFFSIAKYGADKLHLFFENQYKKHGKIFKLELLGMRSIVVSDAAAIKQILSSNSFVRAEYAQNALIDIMKYSLFAMPTNDMWKR